MKKLESEKKNEQIVDSKNFKRKKSIDYILVSSLVSSPSEDLNNGQTLQAFPRLCLLTMIEFHH